MNPFEEFRHLLTEFRELRVLAQELQSPNSGDDLCSRLAIVGFSCFGKAEEWSLEHFELVGDLRRGAYSDDELGFLGQAAATWAEFACLAFGALLGMYQSGLIDDRLFGLAASQLPGFMNLHSPDLATLDSA